MKSLLALASALAVLLSANAYADPFTISYLAPGVQASSASTNVETFNNATISNGTLTTTFNGGGVTGTYTGSFALENSGEYGGANGTGAFITTGAGWGLGNTYTLTLSQNENYFGMWISALDAGNDLTFYNGGTLVDTFTPDDLIAAVGSCPGSAYCGNPNSGQDAAEQFAFVNFYDSTGSFNKIVFTQTTSAGYETDNHTVATLAGAPGGSTLGVTPEPSSLMMLSTGALTGAGILRRRMRLSRA